MLTIILRCLSTRRNQFLIVFVFKKSEPFLTHRIRRQHSVSHWSNQFRLRASRRKIPNKSNLVADDSRFAESKRKINQQRRLCINSDLGNTYRSICQTFLNTLPRMRIFWARFNCPEMYYFLPLLSRHWFRWWLDAEQMKHYYLKQGWPVSPEPGAKAKWHWGREGWMLADHIDGLSSSSFIMLDPR